MYCLSNQPSGSPLTSHTDPLSSTWLCPGQSALFRAAFLLRELAQPTHPFSLLHRCFSPCGWSSPTRLKPRIHSKCAPRMGYFSLKLYSLVWEQNPLCALAPQTYFFLHFQKQAQGTWAKSLRDGTWKEKFWHQRTCTCLQLPSPQFPLSAWRGLWAFTSHLQVKITWIVW